MPFNLSKIKQIALVIMVSFCAYFLFMMVSFGQTSVGVSGYVPETEKNRRVQEGVAAPQPTSKDNKYIYYFEKYLLQIKEKQNALQEDAQTIYDKVSSYGLLFLILLIIAVITALVLRFFDRLFFHHKLKRI